MPVETLAFQNRNPSLKTTAFYGVPRTFMASKRVARGQFPAFQSRPSSVRARRIRRNAKHAFNLGKNPKSALRKTTFKRHLETPANQSFFAFSTGTALKTLAFCPTFWMRFPHLRQRAFSRGETHFSATRKTRSGNRAKREPNAPVSIRNTGNG